MTKDELRQWLVENQSACPGCGNPPSYDDHLHHIFHRRLKQVDKWLWVLINIALVCPACHNTEAPDLNFNAAIQKFEMGFSPSDVREWLASLPLKVPAPVRASFIRAEEAWESTRV